MTELINQYAGFGISEPVVHFGEEILDSLKERFRLIDETCHAGMQGQRGMFVRDNRLRL